MVDAARLRKMVDKVTSLPLGSAAAIAGESDTWDQATWFQAFAGDGSTDDLAFRVVRRLVRRPVIITDRGVMYDGKPCKTACCLAGQTVVDFAPPGTVVWDDTATLPGGRELSVEELAAELLGGLDGGDALFSAGNSAEDLREIAEHIIAGDGR